MKLRARALTIAVSVAAGLLLAGCSAAASTEPEPEPEVLTASEAGGIYLDAVCPVNTAWDEADVELDRLRLTVSRGEDDTRRFAAAMGQVAQASKIAAQDLDPKTLDKAGHVWPDTALDEIAAVQRTLASDQKQAAKVAKLDAAKAVEYSWQGADEVGAAASEARAALGLPSDAESACAQWNEQVAAEKAAAEKAAADKAAQANKSAKAESPDTVDRPDTAEKSAKPAPQKNNDKAGTKP